MQEGRQHEKALNSDKAEDGHKDVYFHVTFHPHKKT
jgi:hypothetical protein